MQRILEHAEVTNSQTHKWMTLRLGRLTTSLAGNQQVEAVCLIVEIVFEGRLETSNLSQDGPTIIVKV